MSSKHAIAIALVMTVLRSATDQVPQPLSDTESYLVYGALLPDEMRLRRDAPPVALLIQKETQTYARCMPTGNAIDTDWRPVVDAYQAANAGVRTILPNDPRIPEYILTSAAEIRTALGEAGNPFLMWDRFHQHFPGHLGYIEVSAVGFDLSKSHAMVYIAHHCGPMCGSGSYHLMSKIDRDWREVRVSGVNLCEWAS